MLRGKMGIYAHKRLWLILMVIVFIFISQAEAQQIVEQGLIGYWSFDKSSIVGNTVKDVKGGHNGTIGGKPEIIQGKIKEAISLNDNRQGDNIVIPEAPDLHTTKELTICLWINFRGTNAPNNWSCIIRKGHSEGANYFFGLWDLTNQVYMTFTPPWQDKQSGLNVKVSDWSYIALRVNGADAKVSFFVDGATSEKPLGFNALPDSNADVIISAGIPSDAADLNATIDELCLYNRFLSDDEIKQNQKATTGLAVNFEDKLASFWGQVKIK